MARRTGVKKHIFFAMSFSVLFTTENPKAIHITVKSHSSKWIFPCTRFYIRLLSDFIEFWASSKASDIHDIGMHCKRK